MTDSDAAAAPAPAKKKKPKVALLGVLVIGVGIGAIVGRTFLGGGGGEATTVVVEVPVTKPEVDLLTSTSVSMDPITVNLAAGHYVQIGLTVVMSADKDAEAGKEKEKETDAEALKVKLAPIAEEVIGFVSGRDIDEVTARGFTDLLKEHLLTVTAGDFHDRIVRISVNQFVAQ